MHKYCRHTWWQNNDLKLFKLVGCCSVTKSCPTLCNPMACSMPGLPVLYYLLEFAQTPVHWVGDGQGVLSSVVLFSSCPQSFLASRSFPMSQLFTPSGQSTGASASVSVLPVNIQDWLSFRIDWFELLAIQGTLKNLLQRHSLKVSVLWHSAFFMGQLLTKWDLKGA